MKYSIQSIIDAAADTTDVHTGTVETQSIKDTQSYLQGKQNMIMQMPDETVVKVNGTLTSDDGTEELGNFVINVSKGVAIQVIDAINLANTIQ